MFIFAPLNIVLFAGQTVYMFGFRKTGRPAAAPEGGPAAAPALTAPALAALFSDCADFESRRVRVGDTGLEASVCWLDGLVSGTSVSENVIRPLSRLDGPCAPRACLERIGTGGVYNCVMRRRTDLSDAAGDVLRGFAVLLLDGAEAALSFETKSQDHRGIDAPTVEKSVLGAKDSFIETLRTNTALVRQRLRTPELKLCQCSVGEKSVTQVNVFYLRGAARPAVVEEVRQRLAAIDIDGLTAMGDLEQYLAARPRSAFPQLQHTERPDRFARGLLRGQVGILADGLPLGLLVPGTLPDMLHVQEDRARHAAVASLLLLLRWGGLLLALLLPAVFAAVAMFHQEMIPYSLLQSFVKAEQQVPFSIAAELLGMLAAFELLQEAGIRLPDSVGQTVSIIGALIVGQSAVEAKVISPIAVIVVALAGTAGYTQPNQELGAAIRIWRFLLLVLAVLLGLFGVMAGLMLLLWRLCDTESFGVDYLYPLCDSDGDAFLRAFVRPPLRTEKYAAPKKPGGKLP